MPPLPIKTLIVDDEPPARDLIANLLQAEQGLEIVGHCANGRQAIDDIEQLSPDLVFLDVQMPGIDGFGVLEAARPARPPDVIFVTAFHRHAVRAFDAHAVDYLLKPFAYDRLHAAVQRIRERRDANRQLALLAAMRDLRDTDESWDRIAVREGRRVLFLAPAEIECVEAEQNYVRLHVGGKSHLLHETMKGIEQR
jgi:two-component system LytT family response regulator